MRVSFITDVYIYMHIASELLNITGAVDLYFRTKYVATICRVIQDRVRSCVYTVYSWSSL